MSGSFDEFFQKGGWTERVTEPRASAPGAPEPAAHEAAVGSGPYKPYGYTPADDLETCDVSWWLKGEIPQGQEIQYRFLVRVGYLGDDQLHLMLTDCILHLEGRNLTDLRKRLARRRVTFIRAFNPKLWPAPKPDEPFIERITLLYPGEHATERNDPQ